MFLYVNTNLFDSLLKTGIIFLLIPTLFSCGNTPEKEPKTASRTEYVYNAEGILKSKIIIKDGKVHGEAVTYYPSGQISTLVNYINNKKEGIEKKYYKSGQIYRIRPFKNGSLNGTEIRYYKDGGKKTEQEFKHNNPARGLKEYSPGGKLITDFPRILFKIVRNRDYAEQVLLYFYMSDNSKNVDYYIGKLIANKYFDKDAELELSKEGIGEIWLKPGFSGSYNISAKSVRDSRGLFVTEAKVVLKNGTVKEVVY
jgi:antitoxin component YwqK of YwqJK toxin-antitoxin module